MTRTDSDEDGWDRASVKIDGMTLLARAKRLMQECQCERIQVTPVGAYEALEVMYQLMSTQQCKGGLLVVPVDMPLLTPSILKGLTEVGKLTGRPSSFHDKPLPAFLPVNQSVCAMVHQELANGRRGSVHSLFSRFGGIQLVCQQTSALHQIRHEQDWERLKPQHDNRLAPKHS
ncbi:hypothetical protein P2G88_16895 [Aliiglaciecola sp. CAU 1673]|nr:hypothetical protein [Aliiglaciecola sp. CAU 1673]